MPTGNDSSCRRPGATANPDAALVYVENLLAQKDASQPESQAAIDLLGKTLAAEKGDQILKNLITRFDKLPAALHLNLAEAAEARKISAPTPDFSHTLEGGDAAKGKDLFMNHLAAQCIRCHKVDGVGPDHPLKEDAQEKQ